MEKVRSQEKKGEQITSYETQNVFEPVTKTIEITIEGTFEWVNRQQKRTRNYQNRILRNWSAKNIVLNGDNEDENVLNIKKRETFEYCSRCKLKKKRNFHWLQLQLFRKCYQGFKNWKSKSEVNILNDGCAKSVEITFKGVLFFNERDVVLKKFIRSPNSIGCDLKIVIGKPN